MINGFQATLITGITSFVATNIDDIVILMLFFSKVNQKFRPRHIIVGQYLGFTVLIVLSLPGLLGGFLIPETWIGLLGFLPIFIGVKELLEKDKNEQEIQLVSTEAGHNNPFQFFLLKFKKLLHKEVYTVTSITIANGGDNIGIYIPLFANSTLLQFWIILGIFYILIALWCYLAFFLTRHPKLARFLTDYGEQITPWILIGLGLFILMENKSYQLIPRF